MPQNKTAKPHHFKGFRTIRGQLLKTGNGSKWVLKGANNDTRDDTADDTRHPETKKAPRPRH